VTKIVLCDIDGTIALRGDRAPHDHDSSMEDAVNWPIVKLCHELANTYPIILMSGRDERYRDVTEYWLGAHNIFPYRLGLIMREAKDSRPDEVVKRELYERHIKDKYAVLAVIDDRNKVVKMWREIGLTCLQVAEGDF
jgi:hypothetical protein